MKLCWLCMLGVGGLAYGQTPPRQPNTPDVVVPPPITLPGPREVALGKQPLTADEATAIALRNHPSIGIAQGNLLTGQGRVQQAVSDLLPNFVAAGSYTQTTTFRGSGGSSNRFTTSVNVDQLLFDFGRTRDAVNQQSALERALRHSLTRTQQLAAGNVRQAFYDYAQSLANVATSEGNVTNRQRQLDQAQARVTAGVGPPSDLVQAKTNLADAAISLTTARDQALSNQIQLAELMGIDPRTPINPAASTEVPLPTEADLQQMVETALANRPDIGAAREQVNAARYAISFAQKGNLPRVTATAGVGSRGAENPFDTETGSFGINVTWSFADSGFTAGAVKIARGNEQVARSNLIQVTQAAMTDVSQAYVELQSAGQRLELARVGVANAFELVRISEGRFSGGIGTFLEVTNAQNSLFAAQRSETQAQYDLERARARLRTATGQ